MLTKKLYCRRQEERADYSWSVCKLYSEVFAKSVHFIAGDKRSAQTTLGQVVNCTARFLQNLSTFLEFPFCTWPRIDGEGPGVT